MPDELRKAAYVQPVRDEPARFDSRLNDMMASFVREMMEAVCALGGVALEFYHTIVWDRDRIVDVVLEHTGPEFWSVHAPYGRLINPSSPVDAARDGAVAAYCDTIGVAAKLGAGLVITHPGANIKYDVDRKRQIELSLDPWRRIADFAGERGVRVAVEPLPKEEIGSRIDELLEVVDGIDRPNVGVNFDVNHLFPPEKIPSMIRQAGSRVLSVHISDQDGVERHWLPFRGTMDWAEVLRALVEVGYTGPLVYETHVHDVDNCATIAAMIVENYGRLIQLAPKPAHDPRVARHPELDSGSIVDAGSSPA